jgi:hypothetical protein
MSLAEGVLQLVEETAQREKAQRVNLVVLEIGRQRAADDSVREAIGEDIEPRLRELLKLEEPVPRGPAGPGHQG